MNNRVFISGRVTGDPSYPFKFEAACAQVSSPKFFNRHGFEVASRNNVFGFEPVSPVHFSFLDVPLNCWPWSVCMAVCLWHLLGCSHVYFLYDWRLSRGARIEHRVAKLFNKKIIYQCEACYNDCLPSATA